MVKYSMCTKKFYRLYANIHFDFAVCPIKELSKEENYNWAVEVGISTSIPSNRK